jgi:uncharacterized membrane protein YeaQ/YmgE (transglycosylase-associated protein family)
MIPNLAEPEFCPRIAVMESVSLIPVLAAPIQTVGFWVLIGVVAGFLARAILPGEQKMNVFLTMLLGIGGALIGGFISPMLPFFKQEQWWMTLIIATLGAFLLLVLVQALGFFKKRG